MNYNRIKLYSYSLFFAVLFLIYYADIPLARFFYNNVNTSVARVFYIITELGSFSCIFVINIIVVSLLFFSYKISNKKEYLNKTKLMLFGVLAQGIVALVIQVLKFIFGRVRPIHYLSEVYGTSNTFTFFNFNEMFVSFPSGHSAGIWALITCLMMVFRANRYIKLLIVPGILVSTSRMVLGMHYLSDIVFGALLGIFITYGLIKKFLIEIS